MVAENGWLSPIRGQRFYQLAIGGWNGTGRFPAGGPERWRSWGVELTPWRRDGRHVLVIGQRGHPHDNRTMPLGWLDSVAIATDRPMIRRRRDEPTPLLEQLRGAWCAVTWTSNAAAHALVAGIPVFYAGPNLMCAELARPGLDIESPVYPEREPVLDRLAWAQWTETELSDGTAWRHLLG